MHIKSIYNNTKKTVLYACAAILFLGGCRMDTKKDKAAEYSVHLIALAPGHFHAALVQKSMYDALSPVVHVYAPDGPEINAYLKLIEKYNSREENPTKWEEKVYKGDDFLKKMIDEKAGNVVVLAGNNQEKTEYIKQAADAGLNVLSDKPMAINSQDFAMLKEAFNTASKNNTLLYDIMTERYEITNILKKELAGQKELFGDLVKGSLENPAVTKESVHHFFKYVSGEPLIRPVWYYDTAQEGDGLVDVTTHLVDLVQWECFPGVSLDYAKDIQMLSSKRWSTPITPSQFKRSTGVEAYPSFLNKDVKNSILNVYANGEMNYTIKGVHAKVSVIWNFEAPQGTGDTHYSVMRGSKANIIIRQGREQGFKPALYVEPLQDNERFEEALQNSLEKLKASYAGLSYKKTDKGYEIVIPDSFKTGHEAHFAQVTQKYLGYLQKGKLPYWEVPNMLAKYYTTTQALEKAISK